MVLILFLSLTLNSSGSLAARLTHPTRSVLAYATSMSVGGLLSSTNQQRGANGVGTLSLNDQLNAAAQAKANDMASRNYWSHNTPEGNPPWGFVSAQGYAYQKLGENLATGFNDESSTISGWMASQGHRDNMLDPAYVQVGFGYANNPDYTSGGGGPMTIVVAYYAQPKVLAATAPAASPPPAASPAAKANPAPAPSPAPVATPPAAPPAAAPAPVSAPRATTQSQAAPAPKRTSKAQVALSSLPIAKFGTLLASAVAVAAITLFASRHILAFKRALRRGEVFVIRHPLFDIALVSLAALGLAFSKTVGFIQ